MTLSRKARWLAALLLFAGALAYRHAREQPAGTHAAATARHAAAPAPRRMLGTLAFTPCTLAPQSGVANVEAQCATLPVPENPALPAGRQVRLHIAWVPADETGTLAPDPVFMLAGGPGQSAAESYPQVAAAFREVLKTRNVILVDQRGTGHSNPLSCKDEDESAQQDEGAGDDATQARRMAERCRDALAKRADLRFYTTTDAVADLEDVRKALGVAQLNIPWS